MKSLRGGIICTVFLLVQAASGSTVMAESVDSLNALEDFGVAAITHQELADQRGREGIHLQYQLSDLDQTARLQDNVLHSGVNGANSVSGAAFTGATGINTIIQNSGNYVIIQESTLINLSLD